MRGIASVDKVKHGCRWKMMLPVPAVSEPVSLNPAKGREYNDRSNLTASGVLCLVNRCNL